MTHFAPYALWLGNDRDARDARLLWGAGIRAIVQVAAEVQPLQPPREILYCRFPIHDGDGNDRDLLALALIALAALLRREVPTLVCCAAGTRRTPTLAACALAGVTGRTPEELLTEIAQLRSTDISLVLWREVRQVWESLSRIEE